MIVLRRSPFRRPVPPPSLARVRQMDEYTPRPREVVRVVAPLRLVEPIEKENALQHLGYMNAVRSLCCYRCKHPPRSVFCHRDETKGGMLKTDCREGWPGCNDCHWLLGSSGRLGKEGRRAFELQAGADTRADVEARGLWPARLPRWAA